MGYLRSRNGELLFKIETTEGVENAPSASTDGVAVENLRISFNPNLVRTNELTGSLDGLGSIVGGISGEFSFDVPLKGSGAAGTAPEWGDILKTCGFAEVITASAIPASAEACASGGSTTTAVLGSSASGTAHTYRGMPIVFTGTVAGSSFISDYTSGKVATLTDAMSGSIVGTTNYQIPANVLYKPASTSIPSGTAYVYMDGLLYKFVGARGNAQIRVDSGGIARASITMNGMILSKTDATVPAVIYDDSSTRPPVWKSGKMLMNRLAAAVQSFSINFGNRLTNPDNPNASEGFDAPQITGRDIQGSVNPSETLVATRDIFADFRAGTKRGMLVQIGATAGNRLGIIIPQALATNQTPGDRDGLASVDVPFEATGQESGLFITIY